jgi:hypothetical protein
MLSARLLRQGRPASSIRMESLNLLIVRAINRGLAINFTYTSKFRQALLSQLAGLIGSKKAYI